MTALLTSTRDRGLRFASSSNFFVRRGRATTWTCCTCDETVYAPPLSTHCTCLDGQATVRLSNAT